jgi:hypothetical protein
VLTALDYSDLRILAKSLDLKSYKFWYTVCEVLIHLIFFIVMNSFETLGDHVPIKVMFNLEERCYLYY